MTKRVILILSLLTLLPLTPAGAQNAEEKLSEAEKLYGLSLIWMEAKYNFVFFDQVPDLNWDQAYKKFIPQVRNTNSTYEYYRTLQRFAALLKDGHTSARFPAGLVAKHVDFPAVRVQAVGRRAIVSDTATGLRDDIPIGSEILSVDGLSTEDQLRKHVFPYLAAGREEILRHRGVRGHKRAGVGLLAGPRGSKARIGIETPDGKQRTVTVIRNRGASAGLAEWVFGKKTKWVVGARRHAPFEMKTLDNGIVLLGLNSFNNETVVKDFRAALPAVLKAGGVIIDLRQNHGGMSDFGGAIAAHFTKVPLKFIAYRTREHVGFYKALGQLPDIAPTIWGQPMTPLLKKAAEPYLAYGEMNAWRKGEPDIVEPAKEGIVEAPVVVLMGPDTTSAAEDMAVLLDPVPNVTFIGTPTNGSTGQQVWMHLPGGGSARICAARHTYADGRDYVGPGVRPDITVSPSVEDIRSGRDRALEKAVKFLRSAAAENAPAAAE